MIGPSHAYTEREHLSCNTVYVLIFVSINFYELLEMHSGKFFEDFSPAVVEGQICNFSI